MSDTTLRWIALLVLWPSLAVDAHAAEADEPDTMMVIDADVRPEEIVNVIRLPTARDAGARAAEEPARDAASGEGARSDARPSDAARDARSAAADAAAEARDAAAERRDNARPDRPDRPDRAAPPGGT